MIKEEIELIAERYDIVLSYSEPGNGGFVLDSSGKVYKLIDIKEIFTV